MTEAEIAEAGDDLVETAVRRAYGRGRSDLTLDEVAERSGVGRPRVEEIVKAGGVMERDLGEPIFSDEDVEAMRLISAAEELL